MIFDFLNFLKIKDQQQQEKSGDDHHNLQDDLNGGQQFKQKQKKKSKGQRVDQQLLGFTVQPDPNLKNRGNIDSL